MKISIDKQELLSALDIASKSVSTKDTLPIIKGVLLEAEERTLKVTGNNLETAIRYAATCEIIEPGKTVIEANTFLNVIRRMPDGEEIDISCNDKEMIIDSGNANMKVPVIKPDNFPVIQLLQTEDHIELEQQELKEMILKVAFAADVDKFNPIRCGVLMDIRDGTMNMVAMNNAGFAMRSAPVKTTNFKAIIPANILLDVAKTMKSGKVSIFSSHNQVMFETEKFVVTARLLDGEFLDYKRFIDRNHCTSLTVNTKEIIASLERVIVIDTGVRKIPSIIKINNDKLHVTYNSETGTVNDEIKANIEGEDVISGYNARIMLDLLKNSDEKEVQLLFVKNEVSALKIIPLEGDEFFYMCMPVRIGNEASKNG